mmetsp:Transcript_26530/g.55516  ORF Transcript_26530/g.55516 Transcript_26530/m.55516 type:complete len:306 (+) Transcript_26530:239-1156(+)
MTDNPCSTHSAPLCLYTCTTLSRLPTAMMVPSSDKLTEVPNSILAKELVKSLSCAVSSNSTKRDVGAGVVGEGAAIGAAEVGARVGEVVGAAELGPGVGDKVPSFPPTVGGSAVGVEVAGAAVVGADVTGAAVVGATVTGLAVVGAKVETLGVEDWTGAAVVGAAVTGLAAVGAKVETLGVAGGSPVVWTGAGVTGDAVEGSGVVSTDETGEGVVGAKLTGAGVSVTVSAVGIAGTGADVGLIFPSVPSKPELLKLLVPPSPPVNSSIKGVKTSTSTIATENKAITINFQKVMVGLLKSPLSSLP